MSFAASLLQQISPRVYVYLYLYLYVPNGLNCMPIKSQIKIYNYLREIVSLKMCWSSAS